MWDVVLDALLDTLKIAPFLFIVHLIIEIIEVRGMDARFGKMLNGGFAPLIGSTIGIIPQCGFSVVAADLYSRRKIPLSALVAVFVATTDEAIPILLSSVEGLNKLWKLLIIVALFSLVSGYAVYLCTLIIKRIKSKKAVLNSAAASSTAVNANSGNSVKTEELEEAKSLNIAVSGDIIISTSHAEHTHGEAHDEHHAEHTHGEAHDEHHAEHTHGEAHNEHHAEHTRGEAHNEHHAEHTHGEAHDEHHAEHTHGEEDYDGVQGTLRGCHHHIIIEDGKSGETLTKTQKLKKFYFSFVHHPLIHTLTVLGYCLIVNFLFGTVVHYVGIERISEFMAQTGYYQPFVAGLVGLIPNCAASVAITQFYVLGGLNLGGAVAGLCCGAGLGFAVLIKQNRPIGQTIAIIACMYVAASLVGVAVTAIGF